MHIECKNCSTGFEGLYCPQCSQRVVVVPHGYKSIADYVKGIFDFDRGFIHTLKILFVNPGRLVHHYLKGKTKPYNNPVRFLLATVTIMVLGEFLYRVGIPSLRQGVWVDGNIDDQLTLLFNRFTAVFLLLSLLYNYAFLRSGYTIIEHIIISLYQSAMHLYIITICVWIFYYFPDAIGRNLLFIIILLIFCSVRFYVQVFKGSKKGKVIKSILYLSVLFVGFGLLMEFS